MNRSVRPSAIVLLILLPLLVTFGLTAAGSADPARAVGRVPDARCAQHNTGIRQGLCFADGRGGLHWLGTLRGYDGVEMYCIDYAFATDWGVAHRRTVVADRLRTSLGGTVDAATVAALNELVTAHPAARSGEVTAAAIALVIRQVMGDVRGAPGTGIPGGLRATGVVRGVGFVSAAVIRRARVLWSQATAHRGPWRLGLALSAGPDGAVSVGEPTVLTVRATSRAGRAEDLHVRLSYRGFTGPRSVHLGEDGTATVEVRAPQSPGRASVVARAAGTPGTHPVLVRPETWAVNRRPGQASGHSQRGLLGRQDTVEARTAIDAVVRRSIPELVTEASAQRVEPGATLRDTVTLSGTGSTPGEFTWSLLGPVPVRADGTCPGEDDGAWSSAPALASGTVRTTGDGRYLTPGYPVRPGDVGCLTYAESWPGTATTTPTTTPTATRPGVPAETILVSRPKSLPCVSTATSQQRGLVGVRIFDTVDVGCISPPDRIEVAWTAHGPVAPREGADGKAGCDQVDGSRWAVAPVVATGTFPVTAPGRYPTEPFTVTRPGCYTFSESVAATATSLAAATTPGIAVETSMVTRPAITPIPSVPTGPSQADTAARSAESRLATDRVAAGGGSLRIAAIGMQVAVDPVGIRRGAVAIPSSTSRMGWLTGSAAAGDVIGSSVFAGHVADHRDRKGPLARLVEARVGQEVVWVDGAGAPHRFAVLSIARYPRSRALPAAIFRTDGPHYLRLITCTHRVTTSGGGYHYTDNLVVTARAID